MNNEQLIMDAALQHHLYTADEAEQILADYGELPLHSLQGWRRRSPEGFVYRIKKGEHGIETRLWKKRKEDSKQENVENTKRYFYLTKTYLFSESQVELVKVEEKENGNN